MGVELNAWEDAQDKPIELGLDVGNSLQSIEDHASQLAAPSDEDMRNFAQFVADEFRKFSGYDRSMVYRFDTDWNGEIIAESRSDKAPGSFLGLNFPSSDIPAQARRLFVLNRVRPVIDIQEGAVPIRPAFDPRTGKPVDLSDCSVRAVSPVHVEYLENMGVRATLNIALIAKGKLWGLLSNHHYTAPYRLTPARAATCRLLAEIFSTELTRIVENVENEAAKFIRDCLRSLRRTLLNGDPQQSLGNLLADREGDLLRAMKCSGAALFIKEETYVFGDVPDDALLKDIYARITEQMRAQKINDFATHFAAGLWPDLGDVLTATCAGMFACNFPGEGSRLILFRKPRETEITWGGDPHGRVQPGEGERLHPRKSFEKFSENVRNRSIPWEAETFAKARECLIGLSELDWLLAWRKTEIELADTRAEVAHAAMHDALTNLPNRRFMMDKLVEQNRTSQLWSAVLHLDLDGFKQINDKLGHAAGDKVLVEVASRLRGQTRPADFCARMGGDEFVVLCAADLPESEVVSMAERLVAVMAQPVMIEDEACRFGASVGIAFLETSAPVDGAALLHRADLALYEAKREGRDV